MVVASSTTHTGSGYYTVTQQTRRTQQARTHHIVRPIDPLGYVTIKNPTSRGVVG
jgi:hypothetical protein